MLMTFLQVKYFRWCGKDGLELEGDTGKDALLEFTDYGAIIPALRMNNTFLGEHEIKVGGKRPHFVLDLTRPAPRSTTPPRLSRSRRPRVTRTLSRRSRRR